MTTEASKSDSLTAALAKLTHDLEALPGKIAAQVAAALKPKAPLTQICVGGVEIPFLELSIMQGEKLEEATFTIVSKYAGQLRVNSAVEICFSGEPVFTGRLDAYVRGGDNIICRAASSVVTADPPLWERYNVARSQLQPSGNVEVEKALQTLTDIGSKGTPFVLPSQALPTS